MPRSLQHVLTQIDRLQKEADSLRAKEVSAVVVRIREAIAHYDLSPEPLFGRAGRRVKGGAPSLGAAAKRAHSQPKYQSDDGRTWSGVGRRPAWFVAALASGRPAEDMLVAQPGRTASTSRKPSKRDKTRARGVAKYASADGRTWTGVGKRPQWFNDALASGMTPEELLIAKS